MREPHKTQKPDKTSKDVRIPTIHVVPPQDYISSGGFWGEERLRPADLPGSWAGKAGAFLSRHQGWVGAGRGTV